MCRLARAGASRVTIVTASQEGPHAAAVEGLQTSLVAHGVSANVLRIAGDNTALRQEITAGGSAVAVGVGIDAVRATSAVGARMPLIATMTFRGDLVGSRDPQGGEAHPAGAVWLDVSLASIAAGVRAVFPAAARFAVVRNRSRADAPDNATPLPAGVTVVPLECAGASDLLMSLRKMRGQVDFVICLPDSELYNKTTVEPLILASLEHRLPLVGYSASFVRAGAAVGVFPDFADIGRQTAALCERFFTAPPAIREERPRRTALAVNERVLHLIGRDYRPKTGEDVTVYR